jgi:hypothetical protein
MYFYIKCIVIPYRLYHTYTFWYFSCKDECKCCHFCNYLLALLLVLCCHQLSTNSTYYCLEKENKIVAALIFKIKNKPFFTWIFYSSLKVNLQFCSINQPSIYRCTGIFLLFKYVKFLTYVRYFAFMCCIIIVQAPFGTF